MSNMPSSFTTFSDSLSWAMLRFDVPGTGTPTADDDGADDGGRRLEDQSPDGAGNASNPSNATTSGMPYESKVKRNNLAGTVFWNGFGLIFFVLGHYWYESIMFKKGAAVPDMFAFPSLEIKLVTLSMPGLLSTSMLVMADKDQSIGYRALGTFVVLWCIAFILLCGRVLHHMEKYKPVRFTYAENFPVGNGEMATYRNAPLRWKAWSLITFKSTSPRSWCCASDWSSWESSKSGIGLGNRFFFFPYFIDSRYPSSQWHIRYVRFCFFAFFFPFFCHCHPAVSSGFFESRRLRLKHSKILYSNLSPESGKGTRSLCLCCAL